MAQDLASSKTSSYITHETHQCLEKLSESDMLQCSRRLFNLKTKAVCSKANFVDTQIEPYSLPHILRVPNLSNFILKNPKIVLTLPCEASSLNFILEMSIVSSKVFEFHWATATYFPHNCPYTFSKGLSGHRKKEK